MTRMANGRLRASHRTEELQGMHLDRPTPCPWRGEPVSVQVTDIVEENNGWTEESFGRSWRPAESSRDEIEGRCHQYRRPRSWNAKGLLVRGGRAKVRGRGRGDFLRHHTWDENDASGLSDLAHEVIHDSAPSEGDLKPESEEPSAIGMDGEPEPRREESNAEARAAGEHAEMETQVRHLLRLVEHSRRTSECKEEEHRNLYKKARLERSTLFNVCDENEKLKTIVSSLRTELSSARTEVDREKKSWRESLEGMKKKHEGKIGKLQGEIEQLRAVRRNLVGVCAELKGEQSKSAQLQDQLTKLESKLKSLQESHDRIVNDFKEEKEKALCQICMDRPRDTCSLPCVHLNYCSQCLLKHLETNKTCPACRTPTSGTLQTSLYTIM